MAETAEQAERPIQLGALDLGSNSFHLLIAHEAQERLQVLDKHKEMVRLAAGLNEKGELSKEASDRALECLERLSQRLRPLEPGNVRIVGTNTMRKAGATDFVAKAEQVLGHKIDIISGREEARLIYLGVCHDLGAIEENRLIADIGGGSTEIVIGSGFEPSELESLYMGCVSMTQKHFADGVIDKTRFSAALSDALVELEPVTEAFRETGWEIAIGTSGTIGAVSEVLNRSFDSPHITKKALQALRKTMIEAGSIDKLSLSGLADERKPVFPGGVAILSALFEALDIKSMDHCTSALREGILFDLIGRQHHEDARDRTVERLSERFRVDTAQAQEVRETALSLLAQVADAWGMGDPGYAQRLGWAAALLEIGMDIAHSSYHKHGQYLLENLDMPGFSRREQKEVATLVRTHRRKLSTELFTDVDPNLLRLAAILRVAAVLHRNRSHSKLPALKASAKANKLTLTIPSYWLDTHPLTQLDLENEASYLRELDITLAVKRD